MSRPPPLAYYCWGFAFVETARLMRKYCCVVALVERLLDLCFSSWCVGILLWSVWAPSSYCMFSFEVREHSRTHEPYSSHCIVSEEFPHILYGDIYWIVWLSSSSWKLRGYLPSLCVETISPFSALIPFSATALVTTLIPFSAFKRSCYEYCFCDCALSNIVRYLWGAYAFHIRSCNNILYFVSYKF